MLRFLPAVLMLAFTLYCLVDCARTPAGAVRTLPKGVWLVLIILVPLFAGISWLIAGRPDGSARRGPRPSSRPQGPDDDPDFLRGLKGR